ncbi:hypothetical protein Tco_1202017 [Tanacetum coccineum]
MASDCSCFRVETGGLVGFTFDDDSCELGSEVRISRKGSSTNGLGAAAAKTGEATLDGGLKYSSNIG